VLTHVLKQIATFVVAAFFMISLGFKGLGGCKNDPPPQTLPKPPTTHLEKHCVRGKPFYFEEVCKDFRMRDELGPHWREALAEMPAFLDKLYDSVKRNDARAFAKLLDYPEQNTL